MASMNWLEFRSGAPDFGSPVLLENQKAYEIFDQFTTLPRLALALGGAAKRCFFQDEYPKEPGISFRQISASTILVDCELHNADTFKSKKARPKSGHLEHRLHVTLTNNSPAHRISGLAHSLYWEMLFPFASVVVLFVDDLGGSGYVIDILAGWTHRSTRMQMPCPPRLIIVHDNIKELHEFEKQLCTRIGQQITKEKRYCTAFESLQICPSLTMSKLTMHIEEAFSTRDGKGFALSAEHLRNLLQHVVFHIAEGTGQQIDLERAVRSRNPPSSQFADHISRFVMMARHGDFDQDSVIASALQLDCYPPGMPFFHPASVFDKHYRAAVADVETTVKQAGLVNRIRTRFIDLSFEREHGSSACAHLRLLHEFHVAWSSYRSDISCFVCLARHARGKNKLTCGHMLCDVCVVITSTSREQWSFTIDRCPLCRGANGSTIHLQPPTSGIRILELRGCASQKSTVWKFLKDLQRALNLPLSLCEHFDLAIGHDLSAYFIQTIFVDRWTLADCKYHFPRLADPKIDRKQLKVSFGKGLDWELANGDMSGPAVHCHVNGKLFSNDAESSKMDYSSSPKDILIQYQGQGHTLETLRPHVSRLTACLFYIELISCPPLYLPGRIWVRMRCRLQPGSALLSLTRMLRDREAKVYFQGDADSQRAESLVTSSIWNDCCKGRPFSKTLGISVKSAESRLCVKIEACGKVPESISNCPYQLRQLIRDQGLDCVFGRKDHQVHSCQDNADDIALEEIDELRITLDDIIDLWNRSGT